MPPLMAFQSQAGFDNHRLGLTTTALDVHLKRVKHRRLPFCASTGPAGCYLHGGAATGKTRTLCSATPRSIRATSPSDRPLPSRQRANSGDARRCAVDAWTATGTPTPGARLAHSPASLEPVGRPRRAAAAGGCSPGTSAAECFRGTQACAEAAARASK